MWDTFGPDVLANIIGAGVGAVLTVAIAAATFLLNRSFRETQALNALISELHHRRAFRRIVPKERRHAKKLADFHQVAASVVSVRDEVKRARDIARPKEKIQAPLSAMTRACNLYLEQSNRNPDRYWFLMVELRESLEKQIAELAAANKRVKPLEPGIGSY